MGAPAEAEAAAEPAEGKGEDADGEDGLLQKHYRGRHGRHGRHGGRQPSPKQGHSCACLRSAYCRLYRRWSRDCGLLLIRHLICSFLLLSMEVIPGEQSVMR